MNLKPSILLIALLGAGPAAAGEPLSLETFFKHAEYSEMVISPGGEYLAVTMPVEDRTGLSVLDLRDYPEVSVLSHFSPARNEHLTGLFWATGDRLLMTSTRQQGSLARPIPTGRVYATDVDGSNRRQIYGMPARGLQLVGRAVEIVHRLPDDEHHVLVVERTHDREQPVAMRLNIRTENRTRTVAISPLSRGNLGTDAAGNVLFATGINDDAEPEFAWRSSPDGEWRRFDNPFNGPVNFYGFNESGEHLYVGSRDRQQMGVYRIDVETGAHEDVLGDDRFEVLAPIWNMDRSELIGAVFHGPRPEARFINPDDPTARIIRSLQQAVPDYTLNVTSYTDDHHRAVLHLSSDQEPGVFMLLDVENMALHELVAVREWVPAEKMAPMQAIRVTARDGLELHGYLTVPPNADPQELPLVVEVHGGPHGPFDRWRWDPWVQAMAAHGYAVLQINFRGSGGYGQQFEQAGYRHWGDKMQDDLADAARWAIEEGIAHPDRICISGASYGGYSAMMSVVREPDLYKCAFAFVGVYDLQRFKREGNIVRHLGFGSAFLDRALGTDPDHLRAHSPVHHVETIKADLFIAHGAEDEQAHYNQYHVLIRALEAAEIPHEKWFVSGEGHGFYKLENNVKLYRRALDLFDRNIGSGWRSGGDNGE